MQIDQWSHLPFEDWAENQHLLCIADRESLFLIRYF